VLNGASRACLNSKSAIYQLDVVNLNNENKQVQIELAKLQTEVKVYRILTISEAAFFGLLVISFLILSFNALHHFKRTNEQKYCNLDFKIRKAPLKNE